MSTHPDSGHPEQGEILLEVRDLHVEFRTDDGLVRAVEGVDLHVLKQQTLALVGESGSGKSVTCMAVMGLTGGAHAASRGSVLFKGRDLLQMSQRALRTVRGNDIAMVFQDPMTSLNPAYRIGTQLVEAIGLHRDVGRRERHALALEALKEVGIPDASRRIDSYPHEFSGGMRQRVMVAMALINHPELLIADEPTTALDVTTQAQILRLLARLQREREMAVIFVTHDLGVVAQIADDVAVMYAGQVVERGPVRGVFHRPRHPYTWGLLSSIPRMESGSDRLRQIAGSPPSPLAHPGGCRFHPRCSYRLPTCVTTAPPLRSAPDDATHAEACHLDEQTKRREAAAVDAALHTTAAH
jgi:peptide/nickel transport system ATP-binding protein